MAVSEYDRITEKGTFSVFFSDRVTETRQKIAGLKKKRNDALEKAQEHERQAKTLRESLGKARVQSELGDEVAETSPEKLRKKIQEHEDAAEEARKLATAFADPDETYEQLMETAEEVAQEYEEQLHEELSDLVAAFAEHMQAAVALNVRIRDRVQEIQSSNENQRVQRENSRDRRGEIQQVYTQKPPYVPSLLPGKGTLKRLQAALSEQGHSIDVE
jgi:DNA repair exonuclease SbcCD ATPase subunit